MGNIIEMLEVIFVKKKLISNLCGHYGEPEGVAKHLRGITRKMPLLTLSNKHKTISDEFKTIIRSFSHI